MLFGRYFSTFVQFGYVVGPMCDITFKVYDAFAYHVASITVSKIAYGAHR